MIRNESRRNLHRSRDWRVRDDSRAADETVAVETLTMAPYTDNGPGLNPSSCLILRRVLQLFDDQAKSYRHGCMVRRPAPSLFFRHQNSPNVQQAL